MTSSYRILIATTLLLPMLALAQEAGTPQYNSVFLPAHGAGDTRRVLPDRWGAWARGDDRTLGWTFSGRTREEAGQLAIADCTARGSRNCRVLEAFANACAAIAAGPDDRRFYISPKSQRAARREALKACGPDCKIVFEGCAMP
ncbi:DUF4189 domain-containing protein [Stenotrophomonas sp. PA-6-5C]|nr:DUF4189 domain-containing protein [Stenotrophomonas sp. PA-6-5C]